MEQGQGHDRMFEAERRDDGSVVFTFRPPRIEDLMGNETVNHLVASQKEMLLAVRSLLDTAINRIDEKDDGPRRTRITVE